MKKIKVVIQKRLCKLYHSLQNFYFSAPPPKNLRIKSIIYMQYYSIPRAFFLEKEVPELTRGERTNIRKAS
jgi:hypothetical protein